MKSFLNSCKYALEGIKFCWIMERNFRIHTVFGGWSIVMGMILSINRIEWLFILSSILIVIISEMFNTSFEFLNDLTTREINKYSKHSKDVAAGAVLLSSIYSIIVGCVIFIPKIIELIRGTIG